MRPAPRPSGSVASLVALGAFACAAAFGVVSACNSLSGIDSFQVVSESSLQDGAGEGTAPNQGLDGAPTMEAGQASDAHAGNEAAQGAADSGLGDTGDGASSTGDASSDVASDARGDASGCAVLTPMCSGGCPVAHSNGLSQTFYDCVEAGTYNQTQATEACAAFTGDAAACVNNPFPCAQAGQVCSSAFTTCACWKYAGNTDIGRVLNSCMCVGNNSSPWY
jgi:hypothetical protein